MKSNRSRILATSISTLIGAMTSCSAIADPVQCTRDDVVAERLAMIMKLHAAGHLAEDSAAATDVYTEDVSVFFEDVEYRSKASMIELYESYYSDVIFQSIEFVDHNVSVCGQNAFTHTSDEYTMEQKSDGELIAARAEAMITWKRQPDGNWKISAIAEIPRRDSPD